MNQYDPAQHSKARLGMVGTVPVVPMMPQAAQVSQLTGMLHIRLMGDSYVRAGLPSMAPASYQQIVNAIRAQPLAPSWSGSTSLYYVLDLEPDPNGCSCVLKAGGVTVGRVAVFPDADIISAEQALDDQYHAAESGAKTMPPPVQIPPADPYDPNAGDPDPDPTPGA